MTLSTLPLPAYRSGTLVNQACEESRRIIEDAKAGKRLAGTPPTRPERTQDE